MAINFPEPPSTSQPYTYEGVTYVWDGVKWTSTATSTGQENIVMHDGDGNVALDGKMSSEASNPGQFTTTERDALTPVVGDMIFNTTEENLEIWDGTEWKGAGGGDGPKPPQISSITLSEDTPGGDRFTDQSFSIDFTMADDGTPVSQKGVKGEVVATFAEYRETSAISNVSISGVTDGFNTMPTRYRAWDYINNKNWSLNSTNQTVKGQIVDMLPIYDPEFNDGAPGWLSMGIAYISNNYYISVDYIPPDFSIANTKSLRYAQVNYNNNRSRKIVRTGDWVYFTKGPSAPMYNVIDNVYKAGEGSGWGQVGFFIEEGAAPNGSDLMVSFHRKYYSDATPATYLPYLKFWQWTFNTKDDCRWEEIGWQGMKVLGPLGYINYNYDNGSMDMVYDRANKRIVIFQDCRQDYNNGTVKFQLYYFNLTNADNYGYDPSVPQGTDSNHGPASTDRYSYEGGETNGMAFGYDYNDNGSATVRLVADDNGIIRARGQNNYVYQFDGANSTWTNLGWRHSNGLNDISSGSNGYYSESQAIALDGMTADPDGTLYMNIGTDEDNNLDPPQWVNCGVRSFDNGTSWQQYTPKWMFQAAKDANYTASGPTRKGFGRQFFLLGNRGSSQDQAIPYNMAYWVLNSSSITVTDTTNLEYFTNGDPICLASDPNNQDYWGVIANLDRNAGTFTLGTASPWSAGDVIQSKKVSDSAIATRYLVIDSVGIVTDTTSIDPGYRQLGPGSNQTITFDSTFGTGNSPDQELPAGTQLKVYGQAVNDSATDTYGPSNAVTPTD